MSDIIEAIKKDLSEMVKSEIISQESANKVLPEEERENFILSNTGCGKKSFENKTHSVN